MVRIHTLMLSLLAVAALTITGCSSNKETQEALADCAGAIATRYNAEVENSPSFIDFLSAEAADNNINVSIGFSDSAVDVSMYSEALVQYAVAMQLKANTGKKLDLMLNTLRKCEGKLIIQLSDTKANSRTYQIGATRLVQLVQLPSSQLNFTAVKDNISQIMAAECDNYRQSAGAADARFNITGGFAQYTLTFANKSAYRQFNQASLTGRYVNILKGKYETYGSCRSYVENLLKSLQIDGYRFVYTTEQGGDSEIKAAIPWRIIN